MSRKWVIVIAVVVIDLIIAIAVVAIVLDRERDDARRASSAATSTTDVGSPYDFVELPDDVDLDRIEAASLVSILLADETGKLTSYGVSTGLPAAQALAEAVRGAEEVDAETAVAPGGGADSGPQATITFVLPNREIVTFLADLDRGLVARGVSAWRIDGDLRALVEAAISGRG